MNGYIEWVSQDLENQAAATSAGRYLAASSAREMTIRWASLVPS